MDQRFETPLWTFALKVYPALSADLLDLQERGAQVNLLIFALWLGEQQRLIDLNALGESVRWQQNTVRPVRAARQSVKQFESEHLELEGAYSLLKQTELAMEQVELYLLWYSSLTEHRLSRSDARVTNLSSVLDFCGVRPDSELIQTLITGYAQVS